MSRAFLFVVLLAACDGAPAGGQASASASAPAAPASSPAATGRVELPPPPAPKIRADKAAFQLGRKFAFACTFIMLDEAVPAERNMNEVKRYATALAIAPPALPTKADAATAASGFVETVRTPHGDKIAGAYLLGVTLTELFATANLGQDIAAQAHDVEKYALQAGIPDKVFIEKLEALRTKPSADAAKAVAQAFEQHFTG
jgi:hypothetical protein